MNVPSRTERNWNWRLSPESLRPEVAKKLAALAEVSDRLPQPFPAATGSGVAKSNDNEEWLA